MSRQQTYNYYSSIEIIINCYLKLQWVDNKHNYYSSIEMILSAVALDFFDSNVLYTSVTKATTAYESPKKCITILWKA